MKEIIIQLKQIQEQLNSIIKTLDTTNQTIRIVWEDNNNALNLRPSSIHATLNDEYNIVLNPENEWCDNINNIPKYNNDGEEIIYIWKLENIVGYKQKNVSVNNDETIIVLNARKPGMPK